VREFSADELNGYAAEWCILAHNNALLRTIVGGKLISVDKAFFDSTLLSIFPNEPVKMATIVGEALTGFMRYHRDLAIAWRINCLIEAGELEVVDNSEPWNPMRRILRRR
jgi:hypothetical protein